MDFEEPFDIDLSVKDKQQYFPPTSSNNLQKLRITNVALYSATPPNQVEFMYQIINRYYTYEQIKKMTITDAGACIGSNTYCLSQYFDKVNFVEISPKHVKIFQHNLDILYPHQQNIYVFQDNYLDIYDKIHQEIILLDPPWSGPNYYKQKDLEICYLKNSQCVSVSDLIELLAKYCDMIAIKLPKNYDIDHKIIQKTTFPYHEIIPIKRNTGGIIYYIVILSRKIAKKRSKITNNSHFESPKYRQMHWDKIYPSI